MYFMILPVYIMYLQKLWLDWGQSDGYGGSMKSFCNSWNIDFKFKLNRNFLHENLAKLIYLNSGPSWQPINTWSVITKDYRRWYFVHIWDTHPIKQKMKYLFRFSSQFTHCHYVIFQMQSCSHETSIVDGRLNTFWAPLIPERSISMFFLFW